MNNYTIFAIYRVREPKSAQKQEETLLLHSNSVPNEIIILKEVGAKIRISHDTNK